MTRARQGRYACVAAVMVVAALAGRLELFGQQPPFRADTDLVSVDVSVHRGGAPVRNLTAADFRVSDNGVSQRVEVVEAAAMPVDVTLVIDLSANTAGAVSNRMSERDHQQQLTRVLAQVTSILRPTDRLRLIASDTYVKEVVPLRPVSSLLVDRSFQAPSALGLASTYDALAAALMRTDEPGRRHLIVAWVKPVDTVSIADAAVVRAVAERSDGVLHVVERGLAGLTPRDPLGGSYFARTWRPHARVQPAVLPELAALTGGTHRGLGVFSDFDAAAVFQGLFEEFRQGYVLRYRAEGVRREGAHQIVVTVPAHPGAEIRSRRGYTVDPRTNRPPVAAPRPMDAARLAAPETIDDLVALFETGDATRFQATVRRSRSLRQWLEEYQAAETPWPAHPRKDAIFALVLATAGLHASDEDTRKAAGAAMVARSRLVRQPLGADPFECAWYRAAVSGATAVYLADAVLSGTEQALTRCPADGRLHLARALARDQLWSIDDARRRSPESAADLDLTAVLREYEEVARGFPDVAAEAHLRAAWAAYRAKDTARALALLAGVPARGPDPVLDYFGHLIRAQVLRRAERTDDAVAAYRDALRVWPGAQSARVGLMTLLVQRGEREESERLSEAVETAPLDQIDPWWVYWQGDYRSFTMQIQQLQEMAR